MPLDSHDITALYDRHAAVLLRWFQRRTLTPDLPRGSYPFRGTGDGRLVEHL